MPIVFAFIRWRNRGIGADRLGAYRFRRHGKMNDKAERAIDETVARSTPMMPRRSSLPHGEVSTVAVRAFTKAPHWILESQHS